MPRWYTYTTIDPLDPYSGSKAEVRFPGDLLDFYSKMRPVDFANILTAKKVLDDPKRIFYGTRVLSEGGWCYIGKPDEWYIREGVVVPFSSDKVFAVYCRDDLIVYTFKAEYADTKDPLSPKNWEERYGKVIWKANH